MGFGRKVGAFLGLVPEDGRSGDQYDEFDGTDYTGEYGRDYGAEYQGGYGAGSGPAGAAGWEGGDGYNSAYGDRDRYARSESSTGYSNGEPMTQGALAMQPRVEARREPENSSKAGHRPVTIKLTGFAEARVIGEKYRDGVSVIMDMTDMADADARRLVDFAAGLAFAKRGSIDKVTNKVFMLLPSDVDFSPEDRREYAGAYAR